MFYVYKYIDTHTDECLYIGKTNDLCKRHASHLSSKKEHWCNRDLRLEYIKLPDKLNMDFYEVYLINKLLPKYNKTSKGEMNIDYINFSYKEIFKEYSKEEFKNQLAKKNNGIYINCNINKKTVDMLAKIQEKYNWEFSCSNSRKEIKLTYKVEEDLILYNLSCYVLEVSYNLMRHSGACNVIRCNYSSYEINLVFDLEFLNTLETKALDPQSEMKELNDYVNEILNIVGIKYSWKTLYEYLQKGI